MEGVWEGVWESGGVWMGEEKMVEKKLRNILGEEEKKLNINFKIGKIK